MAVLALVLSLFVAAVGTLGMISPLRLLDIARQFQSPVGLYAGAALRVLLGVALFFGAPTSRAPRTVRLLGVLVFVAGLVVPLIGVERAQRLLEWWAARGPAFVRAWASFAAAFGLLLAYAVYPRGRLVGTGGLRR